MATRGSENINELAAALSKAQGEFRPAKMDSINPFLKNHYADLGSVIEAAKVACAKYELAVTQPASTDGISVTVTTMLMHSGGQWLACDMTLPLGDEKGRSMAQAAGSIITYLRRYSLSAILGIYADEDTDGNNPDKKQTDRVQSPVRPQAPPRETLRDKIYVEDAPDLSDITAPQDATTGFTVPANLLTTEDEPTKMTLEHAKEVTSDKDGREYGAFTMDELRGHRIGLKELLKKDDLTPSKRSKAEHKLEAINLLIDNFPK